MAIARWPRRWTATWRISTSRTCRTCAIGAIWPTGRTGCCPNERSLLPPDRQLHFRLQWIQTRTAAESLVKSAAEVAQAVVADFQRRLGDIAAARLQQFRRAFHADLPEKLLH